MLSKSAILKNLAPTTQALYIVEHELERKRNGLVEPKSNFYKVIAEFVVQSVCVSIQCFFLIEKTKQRNLCKL